MNQVNPVPGPASLPPAVDAIHRLTVLTLNVHKGFNLFNRRFILPQLREAVRSTGADLVFLQEVHGSHRQHEQRYPDWPSLPQYEYLADSMWPQFAYGRNAVYPHGDHGNALLSKFPILAYGNRDVSVQGNEQRGLLHCTLDVPGHARVFAICVHLGLREAQRQNQIDLLFDYLGALPPDAPVIIAGDFNDWRRRADRRLCEKSWVEAFAQLEGAPARSFPARFPWLRLDRVYVRNASPLGARVLSTRPWSHLSDHASLVVELAL
ncbi:MULTISPECIES: endonuclease/exonuclease/phosphatase family protein [Pseudomonas]|uniref:Metal-dependent hydrolase n=1 Tax=Pseudomonas asplenii TaxID=53407 RepID=A0A0M9GHL8_9PSED|nr:MULTISPECIES: endonuclease/exonuclease/phosphatase family protein [Pseudomonas]KPA91454.1 metal-dependent hydrolase [Pseudomonas fuscovaginae]KPA99191.1 metal-dependent hydrolase [Pseudomonas fuscovaginae]